MQPSQQNNSCKFQGFLCPIKISSQILTPQASFLGPLQATANGS